MMMLLIRFIVALQCFSGSSIAIASSAKQGNSLYDQAKYEEAAKEFEALMAEGHHNGHLLYNLGNTYYRMGQKGKAVATYLEARRLLPRDPDIAANLQFVYDELEDKLALELDRGVFEFLGFWMSSTTPKELLHWAAFLWCFGFLGLGLYLFKPQFRLLKTSSSLAVFVGTIILVAYSVSSMHEDYWGAVTESKSLILSGPGKHNTTVFELREGAPFVAKEKQQGWYRIELSDGKKGWIEGSHALVWGF